MERELKPVVRKELDHYKHFNLSKDEKKELQKRPLKFWKKYCLVFPWCAKLARRDLAVFASQACIERIFSNAGRHCTKARAAMHHKTLKRMVLLNMNKHMIK